MMRLLPPGPPFVTTLFILNYFKRNVSYLRSCKAEIISFFYKSVRFFIVALLSLGFDFLRNLFVWWWCRTPRRWWRATAAAAPPPDLVRRYFVTTRRGSIAAASARLRRNDFTVLRRWRNWVFYISVLLVVLRTLARSRLGKLVDAAKQRALLFEILLLFLVIFRRILHTKEESVLVRFLTVRNVRILLSRVRPVAGDEGGTSRLLLFQGALRV